MVKKEFVRTYNPFNVKGIINRDIKDGIKKKEYLTGKEMFEKLSKKNKELIGKFLAIKENNISKSRYKNIKNHLIKFAYTLDKDLDKATREEGAIIRGLMNISKMQPASITDQIIDVRQFYNWLADFKDNEKILKVIKDLKAPELKEGFSVKAEQVLSIKRIQQMIKACSNPRDKLFIALCGLDSPMRPCEARGLRWGDLKKEKYGLYFEIQTAKGKSHSEKLIRPATLVNSLPYLNDWIRAYPKERKDEFYVFCDLDNANINDNVPVTHNTLQSLFNRLKGKIEFWDKEDGSFPTTEEEKKELKIKKLNPYLLRHSWATRADIENSMSISDRKLTMGHKLSSNVISSYTHIGQEHLRLAQRKQLDPNFKPQDDVKSPSRLPILCPNCVDHTPNEFDAEICKVCGMALSQKRMGDMFKEKDDMVLRLEKIEEMMGEIIKHPKDYHKELVRYKKGDILEMDDEDNPIFAEKDGEHLLGNLPKEWEKEIRATEKKNKDKLKIEAKFDKSQTNKFSKSSRKQAERYVNDNSHLKKKFGKRLFELTSFIAEIIENGEDPDEIDFDSFGTDIPIRESYQNIFKKV